MLEQVARLDNFITFAVIVTIIIDREDVRLLERLKSSYGLLPGRFRQAQDHPSLIKVDELVAFFFLLFERDIEGVFHALFV